MARYVSIHFNLVIVMKLVIISISPGIISVARKSENTSFFPGKLSLENAKAESIAVASTPIVEKIVTIIVFKTYLGERSSHSHASV